MFGLVFFFFKQKTAYEIKECDWSSDVCSSDLQTKDEIIGVLHSLLTTKQLLVESADTAYLAVKRYAAGKADFSDALIAIISENRGCGSVVTFDKKGKSVGMVVL